MNDWNAMSHEVKRCDEGRCHDDAPAHNAPGVPFRLHLGAGLRRLAEFSVGSRLPGQLEPVANAASPPQAAPLDWVSGRGRRASPVAVRAAACHDFRRTYARPRPCLRSRASAPQPPL